ncbi:MAG: Uridine kinase [Pelotomaculum sp. PtaB.Bin104]|nr:MAG: Uridine kinase [Pelotomaculum sp. PtaB.Bin104]
MEVIREQAFRLVSLLAKELSKKGVGLMARETHLRLNRQTVKLGLIKVCQELFPGETLKTDYSILDGVFCKLDESALSVREVKQIGIKLKEWADYDSLIQLVTREGGYYHYKVGNSILKVLYPANNRSSKIDNFRLIPFATGFIIDFTEIQKEGVKPFTLPKKLAETYYKTHKWLDNLGFELVPDVNKYIAEGNSLELLSIAEALQEKEISDIADTIIQQRRAVQVILISGPSSSGKTTFTRRLSTQLRVNGLKPVPLSLDDYYLNRDQTPKDKDGIYDFDALQALDLKLLQQHVKDLVKGKVVETPIYDFLSGYRQLDTRIMQLGPDEILLIEGIHALNPGLLPNMSRNTFFKIYVSALFELNVDLFNRVPTTEVRMIRRMVRDDRFRGFSPDMTFNQWDNVRKGEIKSVFKNQEECDVMFNSSLLYELNALRPFAEITLQKVPDDSPNIEIKERLLNLLSFFEPMDVSKVPFNSILREFIGGSMYTGIC